MSAPMCLRIADQQMRGDISQPIVRHLYQKSKLNPLLELLCSIQNIVCVDQGLKSGIFGECHRR
jgi:hypothetical protein